MSTGKAWKVVAWSEAGMVTVMSGRGRVTKEMDVGEEERRAGRYREGVWREWEVEQETAAAGP